MVNWLSYHYMALFDLDMEFLMTDEKLTHLGY